MKRLVWRWLTVLLLLSFAAQAAADFGRPPTESELDRPAATAEYVPNMGDGYALWRTLWYGKGDLTAVFFLDDQHGWTVGTGGRIFRTVNGGHSWHMVQWRPQHQWHTRRDFGPTFYDVTFISPHEGWIVGQDGILLHTRDGGDTWERQDSGVTFHLRAIAFAPDHLHGWIVGDSGTVLHTTDGGQTWSPQPSGVGNHLLALSVFDAQHVWATGSGGISLVTTNGGASWSRHNMGTYNQMNDILALDANEVWAVGVSGLVFHSTDGGVTWSREVVPTSQGLFGLTRDEDGNLWVSGTGGTLGRRQGDGTWPTTARSGWLARAQL